MCDKASNTYPSTTKFVPEYFITQEMCDKAVNSYFFLFHSIPDWYKTQGMCDRAVSDDPFLIVYCPNIHIAQKMCAETVDDSAALKLIPDWFVTNKMIKILFTALYADESILYINEDSGDAIFNSNGMGVLKIDLDNINLDNNFDEDNPDTIILIRLLALHIRFEKRKALKKELN